MRLKRHLDAAAAYNAIQKQADQQLINQLQGKLKELELRINNPDPNKPGLDQLFASLNNDFMNALKN